MCILFFVGACDPSLEFVQNAQSNKGRLCRHVPAGPRGKSSQKRLGEISWIISFSNGNTEVAAKTIQGPGLGSTGWLL